MLRSACGLKGIFGEALGAYLAVLDKYTLEAAVENGSALRLLFGLDLPVSPVAGAAADHSSNQTKA